MVRIDFAQEVADLERLPISGKFIKNAALLEWSEGLALNASVPTPLRIRALHFHDKIVQASGEPVRVIL